MNNNPFMRMNSMGGNGEFHNIDELFSTFFGNAGFPGMMGAMHGNGEMQGFPAGANVHIFRNGVPINIPQKPTPIIKNISVTMEQVLNGGNLPVEIERWIIENGTKVFEKETIYIEIPKGIDENEMFFFKDKGNALNEKCKGDVKIITEINNTTDFKRNGLDLIYEKTISLKEALCGFSFELKYINDKTYTINNNGGNIIVPGYNKIIKNMGLTRESYTGNLVIMFEVKFPESLSKETIEKLKEIL
jgi:DnaJ family protein A protein 2